MAKHTTEGYTVTFNSQAIGGLTNLPWPANARGEIDVTDYDSSGVETLPALVDAGSVDFSCIFDPDDAGQQALITNHALGDGTTQTCVITSPSSSTTETTEGFITFTAYVQGWQVQGNVNGRAEANFSLRVQGNPTYTAPTT
ncbi:MAG: phage tail tube protein [Mycobacterium sp.]